MKKRTFRAALAADLLCGVCVFAVLFPETFVVCIVRLADVLRFLGIAVKGRCERLIAAGEAHIGDSLNAAAELT